MSLFCQFRVTARDLGEPHARAASNEALVSLTVKRNDYTPEFEGLPYTRRLEETEEGGVLLSLDS